jgi:predicted phage terminase large subunit-like protein
VTATDVDFLEALRSAKDEARALEEKESLRLSYLDFVHSAWHTLKPHEPFIRNWHLEALAYHLEAVSRGDIHRLQVWIPPGTMKTGMVTVFFHPWEWTTRPWLRYFASSYELHLSSRFSLESQMVVKHPWYQARWGDLFSLKLDAATFWKNNQGGTRFATTPKAVGTGEHGHRIIIDDPVPAQAAEGNQKFDLGHEIKIANNWYDGTCSSRYIDNEEMNFLHARILVMQRLHQDDLAAHMLEQEEWTILALPERFWAGHPYAWRGEQIHKAVRPHLPPLLEHGDPRAEGELIWPARRNEMASDALARQLTSLRAPGQLQQWPVAREGNLLKREWWQFYDPRIRAKEQWEKLPKFTTIVISVDTPLKDKETNDFVAIQCYGIKGADRYLLDLRKGHLNYSSAKRAIREMSKWSRGIWKRVPNYVLIENAGYGVELIVDLKREITGVTKIGTGLEGDKISRAEAASDSLESGNVFLPGYGPPWQPAFDESRSPADVADFIANCAIFPHGSNDDDVDAWSQCMNWLRGRSTARARGSSILVSRLRT